VSGSLVWVSGGTEGIGLGLIRNVPYADARVINLSRRQHPDFESFRFDLARPETWETLREHFTRELARFRGERAIFIHNAFLRGTTGFAGEVALEKYRDDVFANAAAPLMLGDMFLRAAKSSGFAGEIGLALMSSAAARSPYEGNSVYCAAKAGVEMWVRVVRRELKRRGATRTWVVAIRPGFVDTPNVRWVATLPEEIYPVAPLLAKGLESGEGLMDIDTAARDIWAALPPPPDQSLLMFGQMVQVER
jgi:benzil reductase ((S)-benzoin forming)